MGAVAEMRRKWEREDARTRSVWRELPWVPTIAAAWMGAVFIPRTGSDWLDALVTVGYGALMMALLFLAFRIVRRARAGGLPVRLVFVLTVFLSVQRLFPEGSMDDGVRVLVLTAIVTPVLVLADYAVSRRKRAAAPGAP